MAKARTPAASSSGIGWKPTATTLQVSAKRARKRAPTKAATLGVMLAALASIARASGGDTAFWLEKLLLVVFVLITVPVSTQMLVRGATARGRTTAQSATIRAWRPPPSFCWCRPCWP